MRNSVRLVAVVAAAGAATAGALMVATPAIERYQDAQYQAEWQRQTPLLVAAADQVRMPSEYEPTTCDLPANTWGHCWRTARGPEDAQADMRDALELAGLDVISADCQRLMSGTVLACSVQGLPDGFDTDSFRVVGATATWATPPFRDTPGEGAIVTVAVMLEP